MNLTFDLLLILLWMAVSLASGVFIALFSYFLDFCFWPGNIFKFYLPWLAKVVLRKRPDFQALANLPPTELVDLASDNPYFKLLGGCVVCFNTWHCIVSFFLVYALFPVPIWCFLPYLVTSSYVVRRLAKID